MDQAARKRLEEAGFSVGTAQDVFELSDERMAIVRARADMVEAIRSQREKSGLTQADVAKRARITQARVSKIEAGAEGVSMDVLFRTLYATGGYLVVKTHGKPKLKRSERK